LRIFSWIFINNARVSFHSMVICSMVKKVSLLGTEIVNEYLQIINRLSATQLQNGYERYTCQHCDVYDANKYCLKLLWRNYGTTG